MMNIPIYRAKIKNSNRWVEGDLIYSDVEDVRIADRVETASTDTRGNRHFYIDLTYYEIEPETLSISFKNMEDKDKKRIFAALNKDGMGGDLVEDIGEEGVMVFNQITNSVVLKTKEDTFGFYDAYYKRTRVLGINKNPMV